MSNDEGANKDEYAAYDALTEFTPIERPGIHRRKRILQSLIRFLRVVKENCPALLFPDNEARIMMCGECGLPGSNCRTHVEHKERWMAISDAYDLFDAIFAYYYGMDNND